MARWAQGTAFSQPGTLGPGPSGLIQAQGGPIGAQGIAVPGPSPLGLGFLVPREVPQRPSRAGPIERRRQLGR